MRRLLEQARELAKQGVKELILVAQETTIYGKDLYGEKSLHLLLKELCRFRAFTGFGYCIVYRKRFIRN